MAGILGFMAAGAAKGFAEGQSKQIAAEREFDLKSALLDAEYDKRAILEANGIKMREDAEIRKEDRTKTRNADDLKTIRDMSDRTLATDSLKGLGDAGVGSSVDAESLKALRENPAALEAYRKAGATGLLNPTRQQQAEADTNSALAVGRSDYADKFESVAKGERQDAKLDAQIERDEKRWKLDYETRNKQFELQMKKADNAEARAERRFNTSEQNATIRARQNSMVESMKANAESAKEISRQIASGTITDEKQLKYLTSEYKDKLQEVDRISKQLESYASTGNFEPPKPDNVAPPRAKDAPSLDDIFKMGAEKVQQQKSPSKTEPAKQKPKSENRPIDRMMNRPKGSLDDLDEDNLKLGDYARR